MEEEKSEKKKKDKNNKDVDVFGDLFEWLNNYIQILHRGFEDQTNAKIIINKSKITIKKHDVRNNILILFKIRYFYSNSKSLYVCDLCSM